MFGIGTGVSSTLLPPDYFSSFDLSKPDKQTHLLIG